MSLQLFKFDQELPNAPVQGIIGVDEAGRGCLAGPVFAAAVYYPPQGLQKSTPPHDLAGVKDSKLLSPANRCRLFETLCQSRPERDSPTFAIASASVHEIAVLDILGATCLAMKRAIHALAQLCQLEIPHQQQGQEPPCFNHTTSGPLIMIDGPTLKRLSIPHRGIVSGDQKSFTIALASICAKVSRDLEMMRLDQLHPDYGFGIHKGYATKTHREKILQYGPSENHRAKFLRKLRPA